MRLRNSRDRAHGRMRERGRSHGRGVMEPRATRRFAPVQEGTLEGWLSRVAAARRAKAIASLAAEGTPRSPDVFTRLRLEWRAAMIAALETPPPLTIISRRASSSPRVKPKACSMLAVVQMQAV